MKRSNQRTALVELDPMHWQWIQDTPERGRAVCRQLGLTLLVLDCADPMFWWRLGTAVLSVEADGWWN